MSFYGFGSAIRPEKDSLNLFSISFVDGALKSMLRPTLLRPGTDWGRRSFDFADFVQFAEALFVDTDH